jgi:hypothetical protein
LFRLSSALIGGAIGRATGTASGLQTGFGYFTQVAECLTVSPAFPI